MFDKNLFDRNAYDRSVSSDGISATLMSTSQFNLHMVIAYPIPLRGFTGSGSMNPSGMLLRINAEIPFEGSGQIESTSIVLHLPLTMKFSGSGTLDPGLAVKTPFSVAFAGQSFMKSTTDFVYQHMRAQLVGQGDIERDRWVEEILLDSDGNPILDSDGNPIYGAILYKAGYLIMRTFMEAFAFHGFGDLLDNGVVLHLPLIIKMEGIGGFILRRLGALNENVLELDGINLRPGEEVTIDTDLLSVFFGYTEDVSSVTTDSVFFELSPGENDIVIDTNTGEMMTVTAIWQNRWL